MRGDNCSVPSKLDDEWRRLQERVRRTLSVVLELLDLDVPLSAEAVEVLYGACSNMGPSSDASSKATVAQSVRTTDSVLSHEIGELVGQAASQSLADQYLTSSRREAMATEVLRGLAVVVVLVAVVMAFRVPLDAARLPDLEHHLSYAVPVAVLAAYLARESAHHRFVSRELSFVGMRLAALMSFADALAGQDREAAFQRDVGTLMFTQPANKPGRRDVQGLPSDQMDLLLARIGDLVHGQGRDPVDKPQNR